MAKTFRPYVPEQELLLPPSLNDSVPTGHLAYFVSEPVDELEAPAYHPVMLTTMLLSA